ncbi:MAG TPA: adenylate/guanylate cyclase domain-containing protein, partial [Acidimicrobiales bacterium]|nr:adenylate/guanylate cyclase domain-containing protein [Acidimicrobiales bacterium]
MVRCGTCGQENRSGARFCDACGAELAGGGAAGGQARKVVTILFADLVGSTSAQEGADPEAVRRWVDRYYAVLRGEVEAHGGRVTKFTGDGVMAVFGIPEVREDDARRAVEVATALHAAVAGLGGGAGAPEQVDLRVGVNTGEVVVSSGDDDVVGDVVNV